MVTYKDVVKNNYIFYSSNLLHKNGNSLYTPSVNPKGPFSHKKIIMARNKGARSAESSGTEIYTMLDIIG
jgi:hypothetical protein